VRLIDELDALEKEASLGPWEDQVSDSHGVWWQIDAPPQEDTRSTKFGEYHPIARNMRSGDAELCAKVRNNWPAISKALRAANNLLQLVNNQAPEAQELGQALRELDAAGQRGGSK
jgi:hypothetical protein